VIAPWDAVLTTVERSQLGKLILQKKGQGHIIHISDFIEEENGWLIIHNKEGNIVRDAHTIIHT
jgi:hypothetical protein